jgi:hypothetical protein
MKSCPMNSGQQLFCFSHCYCTEMQSRMQSMSSDERALYRELNESGGQGAGAGKMNRYGQGGGNGSGNMHRYGQGDNQGYGSGYEMRTVIAMVARCSIWTVIALFSYWTILRKHRSDGVHRHQQIITAKRVSSRSFMRR